MLSTLSSGPLIRSYKRRSAPVACSYATVFIQVIGRDFPSFAPFRLQCGYATTILITPGRHRRRHGDRNSQCYWLSPDTSQQQRKQLNLLVAKNTNQAYEPICIAVAGEVNRDPAAKQAIGFAADYDGLFTLSRLYGLCDQSKVVTQGDLQHHRWVLESINGRSVDITNLDNRIPELEIGEQMTVSGYLGCNRFQGRAALHEDRFIIDPLASTRMFCKPEQNDIEMLLLRVFGQESSISIDIDNNLKLKSNDSLLLFRREDRVR